MKFLSVLVLVILVNFFYGQDKDFVKCIPSIQPIYGDYLFMRETEVTNFDYQEFLFHKRKDLDSASFVELLPDTLVWREKIGYNEPYTDYYLRHPAYRDYPMVGVSKHQAEAYCNWLTKILNFNLSRNKKVGVDSVFVRLPTSEEWIWAAKGGNEYYEYPWKGHGLRMEEGNFQGQMRANFVRGKGDYMGIAGHLNDNADITAPVYSYWPNDFGLYNMAGNVEEMVSDRPYSLGGSWRSSGYDIKVSSENRFEKPNSTTGFRYVVEVKTLREEYSEPVKFGRKFIKNNFSNLNDSILIQKYEVTNKLFSDFITETNEVYPDQKIWDSLFPYYDRVKLNYKDHKIYENYPAVGMTRDQVLKFCKWLEKKVSNEKEKYKVQLMSDSLWQVAARGGLELSPYPWGGPYLFNSKGCALANYRYVPESFSSRNQNGEWTVVFPEGRHDMFGADFDGAMFSAKVDSYHPNDFDLFNMSGNIREMVQENGYTKGGGWKSDSYFLQITSKEEWGEQSAADVGFRVMMIKK